MEGNFTAFCPESRRMRESKGQGDLNMDNLILGLLMVRKFTAYGIRKMIKDNYKRICSHSIGNVQNALSKLLNKGLVTREEISEGMVKKKIFSITREGRAEFMEWLNNPIEITKAKNMEVGRLLLLGFLSKEQQLANLESAIQDLKKEYGYLLAIKDNFESQFGEGGVQAAQVVFATYFNEPNEYVEELLDSAGSDDFLELAQNISRFRFLTLKLGIDEVKFHLEWFENLRDELFAE